LAAALGSLGMKTALLANLSNHDGAPSIADPFLALKERGIALQSYGQFAETDALEFLDGKIFFGQMNGLLRVDWPTLLQQIGEIELRQFWAARIVCLTNWTMIPGSNDIWRGFSSFREGPEWVFVDLAEPAKRSDRDLEDAIAILQQMPAKIALGLNDRESQRLALVTNGAQIADPCQRLHAIRLATGLDAVIYHSRDLAIWHGEEEHVLRWEPIAQPLILTGAGDHFNAGLVAALGLGCPPRLCLLAATALAQLWIQTGIDCTREQFADQLLARLVD
jgi:hypothetical protein